MYEKIAALIKRAAGLDFAPQVSVPEVKEFGDYSTNAAFVLAKAKRLSPLTAAKQLAVAIEKEAPGMFKKAEAMAPGFVNLYLSDDTLRGALAEILEKKDGYGRGMDKGERISLDYLDANPTGPVHLGHARGGFFGDVLSNILEFAGYDVSREFYVNNAKSSAQIRSLGKTALGKGEEYRHDELKKILALPAVKRVLGKTSSEAEAGYYVASLIQKENAAFLKKKAKIAFDVFFEEESIYKKGLIEEALVELKKRAALYEKDGAVWFKASEHGDTEDRVFVRSDGAPTYVLPDIAYHCDRLVTRKFDKAIDVFGADHHGYGPRLKGALEALGLDPKRVEILIAQTVRLMKGGEEFRMSKRKGVFVTLEELIEETGLDAARWFFLEKSLDTHMDFDLDLAKERSQKNPVYYAQYAWVRGRNILKKTATVKGLPDLTRIGSPEEFDLVKLLIRFPNVVEEVARTRHVHRLPSYVSEVARTFHLFYERKRVLGEPNEILLARRALVTGTLTVLGAAFNLLGLSKPAKM